MLLSSGKYILCFHLIKDLLLAFDGNINNVYYINKYNLLILFWQ